MEGVDLGKELSETHLEIYKLQSALNTWKALSIESLKDALDSEAQQIAEHKESYIARKKLLGSKIRGLMKQLTEENAISEQVKALIQEFKTEFDFIAEAAKFSETSFIKTYKFITELEDPTELISSQLRHAIRIEDVLKRAQDAERERLNSAATLQLTEENNSLREQLGKEREERTQFERETKAWKEAIEADYRKKEHSFRSNYEGSTLEIQQKFEAALAQKESEMIELLATINDLKQRSIDFEQQSNMLEVEIRRRRDIEDRLNSLSVELMTSKSANEDLQLKIDAAQRKVQTLEGLLDSETKELKESKRNLQEQLNASSAKLIEMETELIQRPPLNLDNFAGKIGVIVENQQMTWAMIETFIIETVRKSNANAIESRLREQEAKKQLAETIEKYESLMNQKQHQLDGLANVATDLTTKSLGRSQEVHGKRGGLTLASTDSGASGGDKVIQAVQGQRDRYMKISQEKDAEIAGTQDRLRRAEEHCNQLKNDNIELYRRLRMLRLASRNLSGGSAATAATIATTATTATAIENDLENTGDVIDVKYSKLYEEKINPVNFEEFDRHTVYSKLNIFEKFMIRLSQYLLQEKMTRHLLMIYLVVVHFFALFYVVNILNPQLIDEVDSSMKKDWSEKTLSNFMEAEHPDIE